MAQPTTNVSDIQTVVTNVSGSTKYFGFLPYHGKSLANGASFTWTGDIVNSFKLNKRKLTGFNNAITSGYIRVQRNVRKIIYGKVYASATISLGDLLYYDTADNGIKAAGSYTWTTNLATTQANFANDFLGYALSTHASSGVTVTNFPVDISPDSVYSFACVSSTHEWDDFMGVAQATGTNLLNPAKLAIAVASSSIARVASLDTSAATSVLVRLMSAYNGNNTAGDF